MKKEFKIRDGKGARKRYETKIKKSIKRSGHKKNVLKQVPKQVIQTERKKSPLFVYASDGYNLKRFDNGDNYSYVVSKNKKFIGSLTVPLGDINGVKRKGDTDKMILFSDSIKDDLDRSYGKDEIKSLIYGF